MALFSIMYEAALRISKVSSTLMGKHNYSPKPLKFDKHYNSLWISFNLYKHSGSENQSVN